MLFGNVISSERKYFLKLLTIATAKVLLWSINSLGQAKHSSAFLLENSNITIQSPMSHDNFFQDSDFDSFLSRFLEITFFFFFDQRSVKWMYEKNDRSFTPVKKRLLYSRGVPPPFLLPPSYQQSPSVASLLCWGESLPHCPASSLWSVKELDLRK